MNKCEVELGDYVYDILSGFEGTAIGRTKYITGCVQILIQPYSHESYSWKDSEWIDEGRVRKKENTTQMLPNFKELFKKELLDK